MTSSSDNLALPKTRADCPERPCPYLRCKYHLASDVSSIGSLMLPWGNPPDLASMEQTCALDVAEEGGAILDRIGALMHVTRERVRQIESKALLKAARAAMRLGLTREDAVDTGQESAWDAMIGAHSLGGRVGTGTVSVPREIGSGNWKQRGNGTASIQPHQRRALNRPNPRPVEAEKEDDMPRVSYLDRVEGKAKVAVMRALKDEDVTPEKLRDELEELGEAVTYNMVWAYLRRHRASPSGVKPRAKKIARKPKPPEPAAQHEPEPETEPVTALVHVPPSVIAAQSSGYVVCSDGTILAPTAEAAVEVARLLGAVLRPARDGR